MFDFHLHSKLSFDSKAEPNDIISTAKKVGLREICFTDHYDINSEIEANHNIFTPEEYFGIYGNLNSSDDLKIRLGVEFSLTSWDMPELTALDKALNPDFIIGSVHFIKGVDPYEKRYWENRTIDDAFYSYLEGTYDCVKAHDSFDVLGHINYVCKSPNNPTKKPLKYSQFPDVIDEIFKELISKGRGIEVNTSGFDRVGEFLPSADYLSRFKELGGEIVTMGSDAHAPDRVGQYSKEVIDMLKDIFGYVCTFEKRKPIFHKL